MKPSVSFLAPFKNHAQIPGPKPRHFYVPPLLPLTHPLSFCLLLLAPQISMPFSTSIWSGHGGSAVDCGISVGESDQYLSGGALSQSWLMTRWSAGGTGGEEREVCVCLLE